MNGPVTETQWYIARDGKQHGPLTDIEMRTFVAHSYLRVTDLIWRPGMAEWLPAPQVFPAVFAAAPPAPSAPASAPVATHAPQSQPAAPHAAHASDFETDEAEDVKPPKSRLRKLVTATAVVCLVGGGALAAIAFREPLMQIVNGPVPKPPVVQTPVVADKAPAPVETPPAPPPAEAKPVEAAAPATPPAAETQTAVLAPEPPAPVAPSAPPSIVGSQIDARLQKIPVWTMIKKDYSDWYVGHIAAAEKLVSDKRPESDIAMHLAQGLVTLRRQHADKALLASPDKLRKVATAFLDNLKFLQSQSVSACYGFISKGETTPAIVQLMQTPETATSFNNHISAIFEAIDEGAKKPAKHDPAAKADYDVLIKELGKIGWKEEDLQTFSNPRMLSKRPPQLVCQMVLDWFIAHLAVKDKNVQDRLLFETLKPVVTG